MVRSALTGSVLGHLPLGEVAQQRYGAPYATIHRADLHALPGAQTARQRGDVQLNLNSAVLGVVQTEASVSVQLADEGQDHGDVLVAADGGFSKLRQQLLADGVPQPTGHLAYRAMVQQSDLPAILRSQQVTVWLGPRLHLVQYPVRAGTWLNVVGIVHGQSQGDVELGSQCQRARSAAGLCRNL